MKKAERGFTLIEIVLAVVLIGIIAGFVGRILFQEINFYRLILPRKEVKVENKLVFERIIKEAKDAYKNSYNSGNNVRFKVPYNTFKGYTSVRIYLSSNKLYFSTDSKPASIIGEQIAFFNITSIRWIPKRDLIKVKLISNVNNTLINQETEIYLRNQR
ncbi:MAG: type II secretion system GspH family protein [Proteobacteria bacterium]|nr:type II secretion system GspH family protein [Pseudomonadota bacterium]